jgi:hypothetical protein
MKRWGVNQKSAQDALEPLAQADPPLSRSECATWKQRRVSAALVVAGSLLLAAGGAFYSWRKPVSPTAPSAARRAEKIPNGTLPETRLNRNGFFGNLFKSSSNKPDANATTKMSGAPLSLPLFFEANRGQSDASVKFLARSSGYTLFVTPTETVFAGARTSVAHGPLAQSGSPDRNNPLPAILRMKLLNGNSAPQITGVKELPGKVNYLIGNNPRDWHTGVPLYEEVRSREVYPGIDLVFHGDQRQLEYDFQVAPGADPGRIRFKVSGAEKMEVAENGDLLLRAAKTEFRMRKPVIYQQVGEQRRPVDGGFSLQAGKLIAFRLGAYDKKIPLVIDPTIIFASFLGGAGVEGIAGEDLDVTNPSAPKLFVAGSTSDMTTFSETSSLIGTAGGTGDYAFVAKIDPKATGAASLNFLTFIGGSLVFTGGTAPCQNFATDIKVDVSGGAGQVEPVLLGLTNCRDFPVTIGGPTSGADDLFVTRLTSTGAALDSSTLFGGNGSEGLASSGGGASLYLNPEGTIVLSGETTSTDLATTTNAYSVSLNNGTPGGFNDCFVAKMNRSFTILYLTYLNVGGSSTSGTSASCGVGAIDPAGKIYVGGTIVSATAFNLANGGTGANGFQKTFVGTPGTTPNTFVAVLDPSLGGLNQLTYSTYFAGGGGTNVQAGAVDVAHGIAAIVGTTISNSTTNAPDIPLLNAFQATNNSPAGVGTGWIAVIDTTKTGAISLVASSYFGGSTGAGSSSVRSVAIDAVPGNSPTQRVVVGGQTTATNFPTMNPLQASLVGGQNAFVSVFSVPSSGSSFTMSLLFSTYLGGGATASGQSDSVRALLTDSNHAIYALGRTVSANFFGNTTPATTVNGFQTACASCGGGTPKDDLVIFVLTPQSGTNVPDLTVTKSHSGNFAQGQNGAQYSITVTNSGAGATAGMVSMADSLPASLTPTAMSGAGWSCSISTLVCTRSDALAGGASYPVITLTVNVASTAPPSVTNTVTVSGGSETNTANDTASDPTTITSTVGACTYNYIGLTNGSWGTATNWSTSAIPGVNDVACIPSGKTVLLDTGLAAANQTIKALNSSGTLTVSSGPVTISNNSIANVLNINGGTLIVNGQFSVTGALGMTGGTFGGTGEFDLEGAFTWSGGTMCSAISSSTCMSGTNAVTNANAGIMFPASTNIGLSFRTLNNNATATWSGAVGFMNLVNGAVINNAAAGVWNYTNDSTIGYGGGNAVAFNNSGTFEKMGGTSITSIGVPFNNSGTVNGNSGTLGFSGGGNCGSTCSGAYTAGTNGIIGFTGNLFSQSGPINGTGTVNFSGATMDFGTGDVTISTTKLNFTAGILGGAAPGVVDFTTPLNWTGGSMCSSVSNGACLTGTNATTNANAGINFLASANVALSFRTLNNNGTVTWSGANGFMNIVNGSIINNPIGSVWNFTNDSLLSYGGGNAVAFNNAGTVEKMNGALTATIAVPFNNRGTVNGASGTLGFSAGGTCGSTCSGTYTAGTNSVITFSSGLFAQSGPINGPGTVNFSGATMDFGTGTETISTATVNFTSGILGGASPGILNFSTPLNWTGGTMCSSVTNGACPSGTNATTNANAGINFLGSANVALSFRTLNNNATATWSGATGFMNLVNGAVINNPSGGTWNYTNDSTIGFGGGNAVVINNGGTFEKTGGTGTTLIAMLFNNSGTVNGTSGTLSFSGGGNCGSSCAGTYAAGTGGAISFPSGIFAQSGPINGPGTVNFSGATMDFGTGTETISTATVNFTSGILGGASPGILNFSTPLNWTGGTMCSSVSIGACLSGTNATTNANAGINFLGSANVALSFRTLKNNATATWSGATGFMNLVNGAVINNTATGTWNYTNDSTIGYGGGNAVAINNDGTFEKTGGTGNTTIGMTFNNTGTVNGTSGTLSFFGGGNCGSSCPGTYSTGTSPNIGAITFSGGQYAQSGPITGGGTVNFSGATMDFGSGTVTVSTATVNFSSGTIGGAAPGILNFTKPVNWSGGTMCSTLSAGLCVAGTNATTNANGGITFATGDGMFLSGRILNTAGNTAWTAASGAGQLYMQNGSTINNSGLWDFQNDSYVYLETGNSNTFNNSGTLQKSGGTTATTTSGIYGSDGTFNNTGHVAAMVGQLNINGGGAGNGTWAASSGAFLTFGSAGGNGTFAMNGPFTGAGSVIFTGDTENVTGSYNVTGSTTVSGGIANFLSPATVTSIGALTISSGAANFSSGNGVTGTTLAMSGGNLAGKDTVTISGMTTWSGGIMCTTLTSGSCASPTGPLGTTVANGGISFPTGNGMFLNGRILNTAGNTAWTAASGAGQLYMQNGSTINNSGLWDFQNDSYVYLETGNSNTFNNSGTLQKSGGTTATTTSGIYGSDGTFNTSGQVLAKAGTLNFLGTFTQTAGTTTINGGSINFGSPQMSLLGGTLKGVNPATPPAISGNISNSGGIVHPGLSPGILGQAGTYTQAASGAFNVDMGGTIAGTGYSQLNSTGAASLGGALNVTLINAFSPTLGDTFTILTAASVTGTFSSTNLPALTTGLGWKVTYNPASVVLSVVTVSSPVANLSPGSEPFPNTIVNSAAPGRKGQLQNTGTAPLLITSIQPTGPDAANYSYTADATQPCPMSPATLGVGAICMLDIGFLPLTAGPHNNAQITVTDNSGNVAGSSQSIALSGTGIVLSSIAVTPATMTITQGSAQQFTATGTYSDFSTQDLTATATWASSKTGIATINSTGRAQGVAPGSTNITAAQGAVTSPAAVLTVTGATHFAISSPTNAIAGNAFSVNVFAEDQFNNVVPGYTGTVHFTSSDPLAILPANSTLTSGVGIFQVTLKTLGSQTYTATDTVTSSITGTSNPVTVGSGAATHFQVSLPGNATVGTATNVNVAALDQFNNVVAGYAGTVHFTSSDGAAVLPANTTLTNGSGTFPVTFKTLGSQTVTATDTVTSSITGTSNAITVGSGTATHFLVAATPSVTAGTPFNLTVTALDQFNNVATGYTGTVHFTSTDAQAVLPANSTLANGARLFPVTLKTLGSQTVTATDTVTLAITGTSNPITVGSGTATHFVVTAPAGATAGTAFNVSVMALDQFNNLVTGYTGTVHFTSTDAQATLPANSTLTNGTGVFPATLKSLGPQTVTATDTVTASITGTSNTITVGSNTATHFRVTAPGAATAGTAFNVSVTALDQFNNLVTGYTGTVHFTSSDAQATLPANTTLINGTGVFPVTLKTVGGQTVTTTDTVTPTITGTSGAIVVTAVLQSITVAPTSTSVSVGLTRPFTATGHFSDGSAGPVSVNWTSSDTTIATINASGVATGVTAGGPVTITATSGNIMGTAQLTVTPVVITTFPLNVTLIGTGTGSVTDNLGSINCVDTAGVTTGTCSANYPAGTIVMLTATATQPSTFGGWFQACSGTGGCSVTMNSAQSVTASFVPPPKTAPVPFTPGTNVSGMAAYNCPSNPNPSPGNPCLDPNAHATALTIGQVITPFTLTVVATEVPPTTGDGICENGRTPGQDIDCRFKSFFTFQTKPNGDTIVPLCDPYANGNCVVYSVFFQTPGKEPDPSMYVGPINWNITFNNDTFVPPAPYTGSTPHLYYDPSGFVVPNSPYGTDCTTPMLIGNPGVPTNPPIFCQFVFDITTVFDPTKKVDALIGGKTKVFSDAVVAFPPIFAPVVKVTTTPDAATVTAGNPIGFTMAVSNSAAATANNVSLNTPLPGGTNVNWTISPAYAGPGTCAITGSIGSQVLNCLFGTLNPNTNLSVHIQSTSSAAGTAISPSTVVVGSQQLLSIGSIVVQPITVMFSGLTASQSIPAGTSSIMLGGIIGNGTQFAPNSETVSITINGVTLPATVGSNGVFSLQFPTAGIPASTTPYPITYSYAGDSLLSTATNSSTTMTVVNPPPGVNLYSTLQSATIDGSGNYVFTVRVTNGGGTTATATTIKTAALTTAVGTTRVTTASTTPLPVNLGSIASLSSVTTTLTFPASAGPPNTAGIINLGLGFTGGSASSVLRATLP